MGDVFISYKQDERERMRPIADGLRALGVDVWFDERLQPDRSFTEEIHSVMSACKAQIVCWSPLAVASEWVRGEAEVARQRGVLVAVMIEPCTLLPPFNMHHAEGLVGWSGDPKHSGWRKLCDVVGRKVDRPGLGELAALQGSTDAAAWKKWAQKFPNDPSADAAWAMAEELEVSGARERMARDRDSAKRAAEEQQHKREAPRTERALPPAPTLPPTNDTPRAPRNFLIPAGVLAAALLVVSAIFVVPRLLPPPTGDVTAERPATGIEEAPTPRGTMPDSGRTAATAQTSVSPAANSAAAALTALDRISAREWSIGRDVELVDAVLENASLTSLRAAALRDVRAQTVLGIAQTHVDGGAFSYGEAAQLLRLASNRGFARAQVELGLLYRDGLGVTRDYAEARRLFELAANQGNAAGQYHLAQFIGGPAPMDGNSDPADEVERARLHRLAANQGYVPSQSILGDIYLGGYGVAQNRAEAVRLYRLAAVAGSNYAQQKLTEMGESW